MIRDPSDGAVRGHHHKPLEAQSLVGKSDGLITGLPIIEDIKAAILGREGGARAALARVGLSTSME